MHDIIIVGSSGLAKEVAFLTEEVNDNNQGSKYNILGYAAESAKCGENNGKYKVIMSDEDLVKYEKKISIVLGVGNPDLRSALISKYSENPNISFPNIIHPNVVGDWSRIELGVGNVICANNVFTTDIAIKNFNHFNLACTTGHDVEIGSYNVINPTANISGGITIGDNNLIGTGAQILENINVGHMNTIGAGSVVTKEISDKGVYVGIPARRIKSK